MLRVVGLTGGIGSGKSTVADMLRRRGAVVIDADALARELTRPDTAVGKGVEARFDTLDRVRLAEIVFSDSEALADLNRLVHPAVRTEILRRLEALRADDGVAVLEIPLLVESDTAYEVDVVVVVDCPEEIALARLVAARGMTKRDGRARIAAQVGRSERLAAADVVLSNAGSMGDLREQVDHHWPAMAGL